MSTTEQKEQSQYGIILKGIGGFYYVKTADGVLECYVKGLFRRQGLTPLPGDRARVEGTKEGYYVVRDIEERKNFFLRPPVANVDNIFLVISSLLPKPNYAVIDKQLVLCEMRNLHPILILSKSDIERDMECKKIYTAAGYEVIDYREDVEESLQNIRDRLPNKISVFTGNSGVGKSTLINLLCPGLELETAESSKKLGRGKHTTRTVELFPFEAGYIVDTPGFSDIDMVGDSTLQQGDLADYFPEFIPYTGDCYFTGCSHTSEKGCAVLEALRCGTISETRHESYTALYRELASKKQWK
jgi:ribosome biogenesis GTPase